MRRNQSFHVYANHYVLPNMQLKSNGEKTLLWHATDFADDYASEDILSLRFHAPEIAHHPVLHTDYEKGRRDLSQFICDSVT